MAGLLDISARIIDSGHVDQPVNRVNQELSEIGDGVAMVESFSHCVALQSGGGLVCFDASGAATGRAVRDALRGWSKDRVSHLVYTHGHADHVGGSMFFADDRPTVVGHEHVTTRLDRYEFTNNWNPWPSRTCGPCTTNRSSWSGASGGSSAVGGTARPRA